MNNTNHPQDSETDNVLTLQNGSNLQCYPKEEGGSVPEEFSKRDIVDLFLNNAFFLYQNRDRIYADSRMFLTPIPLWDNDMFHSAMPSLGSLLVWWDSTEIDATHDREGRPALIYHAGGFPLSGSCIADIVYPDGNTTHIYHPARLRKVIYACGPSYSEAREKYQHYNLAETIAILKEGDLKQVSSTHLIVAENQKRIQQKRIDELTAEKERLTKENETLTKKYINAVMQCHNDLLNECRAQYWNLVDANRPRLDELNKQKVLLKELLINGIITSDEFHNRMTSVSEELNNIHHSQSKCMGKCIQRIAKVTKLKGDIIAPFLKQNPQKLKQKQ